MSIRVEKRGTRHWVVLKVCEGYDQVIFNCINKRDALKYIANMKIS